MGVPWLDDAIDTLMNSLVMTMPEIVAQEIDIELDSNVRNRHYQLYMPRKCATIFTAITLSSESFFWLEIRRYVCVRQESRRTGKRSEETAL
jgi:hypothetical protein